MHTPLTFAEILSALSHALDITEGQPRGHAVRTAYLALRIGKELQLPDTDMRDLYKAAYSRTQAAPATPCASTRCSPPMIC